MNVPRKQFLMKLGFGAGAILLLSLYFSMLLEEIFTRSGVNYSIGAMIRCVKAYGFPTGIFLVILGVFTFAFGYFMLYEYKEMRHMDKMGRLFKHASSWQSFGDSHFEVPTEYSDVACVQSPDRAYGTIFGQLDESGNKLINFRMDSENRNNAHVAVIGASGTGKTFTFTKPFCYQAIKRRESVILTDPDGGLYSDLAGLFEDNGYIVRRLDMTNIARSDGWDCLRSCIDPANAEEDAKMFANIVISNITEKEDIYATGPKLLLTALVLRVMLGDDFPEEQKTIGTVCDMLENPGGLEYLDAMFYGEGLCDAAQVSIGPYTTFRTSSANLSGNLMVNLAAGLQVLRGSDTKKMLATPDMPLELPGLQPCAYFCIFPDSNSTYKVISSLFFSMLFVKLINMADANEPTRRLPVTVNFLLDEFPSIGKLPDWDKKMATIRKRGMNAIMIFQTLGQFQSIYKDSWDTILGNCATWLVIGVNDENSADVIAKRIGYTTVLTESNQYSDSGGLLSSAIPHSQSESRRELMGLSELFRLHKDDSLIIFQWHNPIWAKKYPHTLHPFSKELRKIDPRTIPSIKDDKQRKIFREEQDALLADYYKKHPHCDDPIDYAALYAQEAEENDRKLNAKKKVRGTILSVAGKLSRSGREADGDVEDESFVVPEEFEYTEEESLLLPPDEEKDEAPAPEPVSVSVEPDTGRTQEDLQVDDVYSDTGEQEEPADPAAEHHVPDDGSNDAPQMGGGSKKAPGAINFTSGSTPPKKKEVKT